MPAPDSQRGTAGFTLIEVVVALVILSGAVTAFFALVSTATRAAARSEAAAVAYDRRMNALELATTLNPMADPDGILDLGGYRIRWSSRMIREERQNSAYPTGKGGFAVALYRVTLSFPDDREVAPIEVTRLGFRPSKPPPQPAAGPGDSLSGL